MPSNEALDVFVDYCNKQNTLFAPDHWFRPYRQKLEVNLPATITNDHVAALREALLEHVKLDTVNSWLTEAEAISWEDFKTRLKHAHEAAELEAVRRGFFPREDVEACRARQVGELAIPPELADYHALADRAPVESLRNNSKPCRFCGAQFEDLAKVFFVSPAWTWEKLCGRAGWLTICDKCNVQVQFFCELMN